ncbi:MAG: RNA polymerase factor sigma-54 [Alphaproteobacteria bacterium]|nr:RNA polymerase factor sigma-54 [Alphaproteobacteria bacterium]
MNLAQNIEQKQAQTLVMTPQLQQAIKLLQMSNLELGSFIEEELERNPLLEREESFGGEKRSDVLAENFSRGPSPSEPSSNDHAVQNDPPWDSTSFPEDPFSGDGRKERAPFDDPFDATKNIAEKQSLRMRLQEQVNVDFPDPADRMIAMALIELLDEAGYLPPDVSSVCDQLGARPEHVDFIVARLQRFEPCGIFARSLHECLALQLHERNRLDPAMGLLLQNLDLLARRKFDSLMKRCNVSAEDLADMIAEIRCLNPKPAADFASDVTPPIVPDVFLRPQPDGGWHIELNTATLPRVLANERYYAKIQASANRKADKDYIADHWQKANWLIKAMHQRATTILKVSSEIVRQQEAFFSKGVHYLKPLVLKDIAEAVSMHESTISRVTQHKYIATPRGLFELKYFFTTALARSDGGDAMSSEAVRARIRMLIETERPQAVLSDDHLSMILRGEGIDIARRTVAKYREAMNIPTSARRRREKRSAMVLKKAT